MDKVHDIVQEAVIKTILKKKKCKKAKWLFDEALQIAEKRREAKVKGEKKNIHLNAEFQTIARRDKKAFLSDQCKEIEENDRMGDTKDLFSHEIKRHLLLRRKVMTNLDSIFKSRDITLPTKVRLVKAMVFPVIMYGCESWTMKKVEC